MVERFEEVFVLIRVVVEISLAIIIPRELGEVTKFYFGRIIGWEKKRLRMPTSGCTLIKDCYLEQSGEWKDLRWEWGFKVEKEVV